MATTEHTINDAIAELLRGTRWAWRGDDVVRSESTQLLARSPGVNLIFSLPNRTRPRSLSRLRYNPQLLSRPKL